MNVKSDILVYLVYLNEGHFSYRHHRFQKPLVVQNVPSLADLSLFWSILQSLDNVLIFVYMVVIHF